ncbi:uncharacterized protein MEPE_02775 [Melanopsichium pennsylvanicum]|uniref:RING-CH-type domain-containing protein n=2 Tax=Melanopsichium pennsylvanicum TaxID=63383 RepID=A0AAJ4XKP3_9BASI|nr:conserved hypothetical protein [Melanopsichium pennsylvanicum 4]SNX84067.1 uncharacterized protein MEPE_02775 [Melanopsichium pennsylvanicum]
MDAEGIHVPEERREEEEVEFILGALPSLWHNTHNVLRDLGYQRQLNHDEGVDPQQGLRQRRTSADGSDQGDANQLPTSKSTLDSGDEAEEKVCRMCFSSEDELGDDGMSLGRLIAPCHCDGSMRYVHDTCLDQWRRKSAASEAARVCGQCHARYRFKRSPYSSLVAFVQASQMLRILFCVLVIFVASFVSGLIAFATLRTIARFDGTPLGLVRSAALRPVQVQNRPWNITVHKDEPVADVWMPADLLNQRGRIGYVPHIFQDAYEKADLEVFSRIRKYELHNPVYWKKVRKPLAKFRSNYTDPMIVRAKLRSGEDVTKELERLSQGLPLFPLNAWYADERPDSKQQNSTIHPVGPLISLQTPYSLTPSLRERLVSSQRKLGFLLPFLSPKNRDGDSAESDGMVELWYRQNMTIKFTYEESPADMFLDPLEHFLVQHLPEWLGFLRYVPYGFVLAMIDRFHFVVSVFRPWWSSITRSALQLALLLLESHREMVWCATKVAVAGLIAYIDVEFEPVRWNPRNAVIVGPARTRSRRISAVVREVLALAADSVFGPLWLNWWGGYSLSVYMAPRQFMTTERVEMTQLAAVFAPAVTLLIDVAFSGLATFSKRAARFQSSHTSRWTTADWVHNDYSASEGYRRMIATLLGDEDAGKASLFDLFLEAEQARLLPGRTRPQAMALLPKTDVWKTVMLLGCLVTTTVALLIATWLAWDTTISHFARQAWRSAVSIYQLIMHSADSFRHLWRQTRDSLVFIVRFTLRKLKAYGVQFVRTFRNVIPASRRDGNTIHGEANAPGHHNTSVGLENSAERPPPPPQVEQMAEALLNDPFLQGASHMGIFGAILGHVASIYGCVHAFVFTMRFILVYLPFEPFMIVYAMLQKWIQVDIASTEVLDREEEVA